MIDLRLRLTWPDQNKPDDFVVWDGDQKCGRMYKTRITGGLDRWRWTVYGISIRAGMIDGGVPNGLEETREHAMTKFKEAWARVRRHNAKDLRVAHRPRRM